MTQAIGTREVSPVNAQMFKANGATPVQGEAPGTANKGDIHFEELGRLADFPNPPHASVGPEEGVGEYVVVLTDYLSGAGPHDTYLKGHVRRLSRIIPFYVEEPNRDVIKGRIKRLFDDRAIRLATKDEWGQNRVTVTVESESASVTAERNKRILLESENEVLREQLANSMAARQDATPATAGQSDAAQDAAAVVTTGDGVPAATDGATIADDAFDA